MRTGDRRTKYPAGPGPIVRRSGCRPKRAGNTVGLFFGFHVVKPLILFSFVIQVYRHFSVNPAFGHIREPQW